MAAFVNDSLRFQAQEPDLLAMLPTMEWPA